LFNDSRLARGAGQAGYRRWPVCDRCGNQRKEAPAMGNMYLAASKSSSGQYTTILVLVVLFGLFYLLIIRPQRNRQRRAQQMQGGVMPGQRVRTTAGIYGTITSIDDPDVELEIAPGVEIRILRRAIMDIIPEDSPAGQAPPQPEPDTGDNPGGGWDTSKGDSTGRNP
jgi:preprotein translocase subunit YajC